MSERDYLRTESREVTTCAFDLCSFYSLIHARFLRKLIFYIRPLFCLSIKSAFSNEGMDQIFSLIRIYYATRTFYCVLLCGALINQLVTGIG